MADVLNTTTIEMRASVNEGAAPYNAPPWIVITREQFDLWSIIPQRYRRWTGSGVEEMTTPEKAAVDLALLEAQRDAIIQQLDQMEDILRAFAQLVMEQFNNHSERINGVLNAIDSGANIGAIKTAVAQISNLPTLDFANLRAAIRNKIGS